MKEKNKKALEKIEKRLRKPLFKGGVKTGFKGKALGVSTEAGIKGLLRI